MTFQDKIASACSIAKNTLAVSLHFYTHFICMFFIILRERVYRKILYAFKPLEVIMLFSVRFNKKRLPIRSFYL